MMLAHPLLENPIEIKEGKIYILVIENPIAMRNTVCMFKEYDSRIVLSEDFQPVDIEKNIEFMDNIFGINFDSKSISAKIDAELENLSLEYPTETTEIVSLLNDFGAFLTTNVDFPVKFSFVQETSKLIKMLNFGVDTEDISMPEKILLYMELCRRFFRKKLFVFLNLKHFLSKEELVLFYKNIEYEKFCVLLLESTVGKNIAKSEEVLIIDDDLCII